MADVGRWYQVEGAHPEVLLDHFRHNWPGHKSRFWWLSLPNFVPVSGRAPRKIMPRKFAMKKGEKRVHQRRKVRRA